MDIDLLNKVLDIMVKITILAGIPIGLYKYFLTVKQDREDREYISYDALDQQYSNFLLLCLEHPELDVFDTPADCQDEQGDLKQRKEMIAFTILISIFERAFLMFRNQPKPFRVRQWQGWENYMRDYANRPNFLNAWNTCNADEFDGSYFAFMSRIIREEALKQNLPAAPDGDQKPLPPPEKLRANGSGWQATMKFLRRLERKN